MSIPENISAKKLPDSPGVYLMKDARGKVLYVGKAGNLKRRVESYFARPHEHRIQMLVREIRKIDIETTATAIEALLREAELIKKLKPPYNVREKDDKSFLSVEITDEPFPRVLLVRARDPLVTPKSRRFGPFTAASQLREAMRILRKIFPWSEHDLGGRKTTRTPSSEHRAVRPCFNYQIGLCPGTCAGMVTKSEYRKKIRYLILFLEGKRSRLVRSLEREMATASKKLDFEKAAEFRGRLFALRHIQDVALISENTLYPKSDTLAPIRRIEGYDISNISGDAAVGSMVVFENGAPKKSDYRKFRIKTMDGPNDTGMMREVISRRLRHAPAAGETADESWPLPSLILVDGGLGQVHAAERALKDAHMKVPVVGITKGPERKRNDIVGSIPEWTDKRTLERVRDEAHRFAIAYHKNVRGKRIRA